MSGYQLCPDVGWSHVTIIKIIDDCADCECLNRQRGTPCDVTVGKRVKTVTGTTVRVVMETGLTRTRPRHTIYHTVCAKQITQIRY